MFAELAIAVMRSSSGASLRTPSPSVAYLLLTAAFADMSTEKKSELALSRPLLDIILMGLGIRPLDGDRDAR